jgi:hypothetical protein
MKPPGSILENHDTMFVCVVTAELQLFLGAALKVTAYTCPQFFNTISATKYNLAC